MNVDIERRRERQRAATRAYRSRHRERVVASRKRCYAQWLAAETAWKMTPLGWAKWTLIRLRHRAKKRGLDFNITVDDLHLPDVCPVLGVPLKLGAPARGFTADPHAPSVDRVDNSLGYVSGNVRVISVRANALKSDATCDEARRILAYMEANK